MNRVAIVILNWNGVGLLEQFLPSVVQYSSGDGVEIVVADNCSTDNSISFLEQNYPSIRRIELAENYGYAGGYNKALEQVEAEYYVLLNSDVEVTDNWLQPIVKYLDQNSAVAAAQPKILSQRSKEYFEYAGASGGYIDKYGYPFCRGRILGKVEKDEGQYDDVVDILWASGACLFIRSDDFWQVGGFDASFFAHMEEIDLCWRLNALGCRISVVPSSVVYHVGAATLAVESPRKTFLNFRNNLLMLYKNLPDNKLGQVMRIRRVLDYAAVLKFVLGGQLANAKAILKAHKEFKENKCRYDELRLSGKEVSSLNHTFPIYSRSILYDFYVKGYDAFSKLPKFLRKNS